MSVGGGTSGAVLASRLTEDAENTVLLIEAGSDPRENQDVDIPLFADHLLGGQMDWQYKTVPQKGACKAHNDKVGVHMEIEVELVKGTTQQTRYACPVLS